MAKDGSPPSNGAEIMLFGVRVVVDSIRKSVSLNNLSQYEHRLDSSSSSNDVVVPPPSAASGGYASADDSAVLRSSAALPSRERKRGVPWTEEEHKLFLLGLQKVGKGDWRGISRNFVKTRTPTQVASHAQKYFIRRNNLKSKGRRRSSLFDITTDTVTINQTNDQQQQKSNNNQNQEIDESNLRFSVTQSSMIPITTSYNEVVDVDHDMKIVSPVSTNNSNRFDLYKDDSFSLSLNLSLSMPSSSLDLGNTSSFQVMREDNRISVA